MIDDDDTDKKLELEYRSTWMCSNCGRRYSMTVNVCECCMDRALEADEEKLRQLGVNQ